MANVILILGSTSSGKSSAIKTLNPDESFIINVCKKPLPFRGAMSRYSTEKKNLLEANEKTCTPDSDGNYTLSMDTVIKYLNRINEALPNVKTIVIDDALYLLKYLYIDQSKDKGYGKFNDYTIYFKRFLLKCQSLRPDINVYINLHPGTVEDENRIISYEVSMPGKMINSTINPLENSTIVLYARPKFNSEGKPEYGFYTNSRMIDGIILPAKTPEGMFEEEFIPNDLNFINQKINEYLYTEE